MVDREFSFAFEARYARTAKVFGIRPDSAGISVTDETLVVRFGPWRVETARDNIADVTVTGPYSFWKTAGSARLAITDRGLTFATNSRAGVCLEFREAVRGIDPVGLVRHSNLTVTPEDVAGLAAALARPADE